MTNLTTVEAGFGRIALLSAPSWERDEPYHRFLQRSLPRRLGEALEPGCGTGQFAPWLASLAKQASAMDLSCEMLSAARFDRIASLATLHHLPTEEIPGKMWMALRAGRPLPILNVRRAATVWERLLRGSFFIPLLLHFARTGRLRPFREARAIWKQNGAMDRYLSLDEARAIWGRTLPGAHIRPPYPAPLVMAPSRYLAKATGDLNLPRVSHDI